MLNDTHWRIQRGELGVQPWNASSDYFELCVKNTARAATLPLSLTIKSYCYRRIGER